ncbi:tetraacyldisaccharide 4'-kinase [Pendulispora albinea]|uniref:Tetraacyldisaccharide 4'-kinase n=1 Tax=Pendulispora albinea TaxID=2741071 RepID=A0ABZ2M077_9BACT
MDASFGIRRWLSDALERGRFSGASGGAPSRAPGGPPSGASGRAPSGAPGGALSGAPDDAPSGAPGDALVDAPGNTPSGASRRPFADASARALERMWQAWSAPRVVRSLHVPDGVVTIAVGGATLGGSGKTPLAIACAEVAAAAAAESGAGKVALIGHAYRAHPRTARVVAPGDALDTVGDEALACAHIFAAQGIRADVIVAPTRQRAIDFAVAQGAKVLVLDGVAQTAPRRADLALLALDLESPWGRGACPPRGDLKAPMGALRAACDTMVMVAPDPARCRGAICSAVGPPHSVDSVESRHGNRPDLRPGDLVPFEQLARMKVGLVTALARPERIVRFLQAHGVFPRTAIHASDHGPVSARTLTLAAEAHRIEVWVATYKCAIHLRNPASIPVCVLEHHVALPPSLRHELHAALLAGARAHMDDPARRVVRR